MSWPSKTDCLLLCGFVLCIALFLWAFYCRGTWQTLIIFGSGSRRRVVVSLVSGLHTNICGHMTSHRLFANLSSYVAAKPLQMLTTACCDSPWRLCAPSCSRHASMGHVRVVKFMFKWSPLLISASPSQGSGCWNLYSSPLWDVLAAVCRIGFRLGAPGLPKAISGLSGVGIFLPHNFWVIFW